MAMLYFLPYDSCPAPLICLSLSIGEEQEYLGQEEQRTFARPDEDRRPKLFAGLKLFVNR